MRISYGPWGETLEELASAARAAEEAGAEVLWVPELHRSALTSAMVMAGATSTALIGTAISLAFTRAPMVTALEALDVDEASGGRFLLGLGTGVRRLNEDWYGVEWTSPAKRLRETVECIRTFWAQCATGAPMTAGGDHARMSIRGFQRPFPQPRTEIPVYLGAMGPVLTRLTAEIAEGFISHELCSPAWLAERITPDLEAGLGRSGRPRESLDVVVSAACSIDDHRDVAVGRNAGLVGFYASVRSYADFFAFHDLADDQDRVVEAFRGGAGADHLGGAVGERAVRALTLAGTGDDVRARLSEYARLTDTVKLTPPTHGLPAAETRAAQARIIDLIADLRRNGL